MIKFISAALVGLVLLINPVFAQNSDGTITISIKEYESLKEKIEAKTKDQYWKMTFEQILEKERGDAKKAWGLYEYWVLRTVYLNGNVASGSVNKLISDINILNEVDQESPITMSISSWGGSVFDGLRLYNSMMASKAPVYTVCDGMAVSMAAVLMSAGDFRIANEGCSFMTHQVAAGSPGGKTIEQISWAETLLDVENILLAIMAKHSGLDIKEVRVLGEYETFYNADEIVRLGFADISNSVSSVKEDRDIPEDLLPSNRMKENFNERLTK